MLTYLDTSVLFPALTQAHPNHKPCLEAFRNATEKGNVICLSMHLSAELYSNLTRFPTYKLSPQEAEYVLLNLMNTVLQINLDDVDYRAAIKRCANNNLSSGIIYDALHLQAAIKAKVDVFYTANVKDFERLWDEEVPFPLKGIG